MKITITVGSLLDDIYAGSALQAISHITSSSSAGASLLTPDRRAALRRFIIVAAAELAGGLARRLLSFTPPDPAGENDHDDAIEFEVAEPVALTPDALRCHLSSAMTFGVLRLVALASGDYPRADAFEACRLTAIATIDPCPHRLRRPTHWS